MDTYKGLRYTVCERGIKLGNEVIQRPSALFDKEYGVLIKIGEYFRVEEEQHKIMEKDKSGVISKNMVIFEFKENAMTKEEIAEIMNKMLHISGYCRIFYNKNIA